MTTLEKIRAEIENKRNVAGHFDTKTARAQVLALSWVIDLIDKYAEQEPTYNKLSFPNTFDEFVEQYGITDTDEVYTNGSKLIPAFRVKQWLMEANINGYTQGLKDSSKAEQEPRLWNNHQVACLLADMFGDNCACNYNGIDEWLPKLCDFKDTCCPKPVGVACWEQFLKHSRARYCECGYEMR